MFSNFRITKAFIVFLLHIQYIIQNNNDRARIADLKFFNITQNRWIIFQIKHSLLGRSETLSRLFVVFCFARIALANHQT